LNAATPVVSAGAVFEVAVLAGIRLF